MKYNWKMNPNQTNQHPDSDNPLLPIPVSDEQWQAVVDNDASYDGHFLCSENNRDFCRPSCKSRVPKEKTLAFENTKQALAANFRPCKRCKPTGQRMPDEEWIAFVTEYVDSHYEEKLTLEVLALLSHGTPYHLHRTFKKSRA